MFWGLQCLWSALFSRPNWGQISNISSQFLFIRWTYSTTEGKSLSPWDISRACMFNFLYCEIITDMHITLFSDIMVRYKVFRGLFPSQCYSKSRDPALRSQPYLTDWQNMAKLIYSSQCQLPSIGGRWSVAVFKVTFNPNDFYLC